MNDTNPLFCSAFTRGSFVSFLLSGIAEHFDDHGTGARNAESLVRAKVRPAFLDISSFIYPLMYAKAKEYIKKFPNGGAGLVSAVAFDVMFSVTSMCQLFRVAPIACFDSGRSLRRELVYKDYKIARYEKNRKYDDEITKKVLSYKNQVTRLLRTSIFPLYNVMTFCVNGFETDDVIASFVLGLKNADYSGDIVIASSDGDLHQLVTGTNVYWADVMRGVLCSKKNIEDHDGMPTESIVAYKTFCGCKSDFVPGIPQFGPVSFKQLMGGGIESVKSKKARESFYANEDVAWRNYRLVRLPFENTPPLLLSEKRFPKECYVSDDIVSMFRNTEGFCGNDPPMFSSVISPTPIKRIDVIPYSKVV